MIESEYTKKQSWNRVIFWITLLLPVPLLLSVGLLDLGLKTIGDYLAIQRQFPWVQGLIVTASLFLLAYLLYRKKERRPTFLWVLMIALLIKLGLLFLQPLQNNLQEKRYGKHFETNT